MNLNDAHIHKNINLYEWYQSHDFAREVVLLVKQWQQSVHWLHHTQTTYFIEV